MKRWILAILVLLIAAGTAYFVVRNFRPPGAMTVLESQAMDMSAMQPPAGVMPVSTEAAKKDLFGAAVTYSGTVVALGDQDITARVTGRVDEILVYPGQRVLPGQLLVRLDSVELASRVEEARAGLLESQQQVGVKEAEWRSRQREQQATGSAVPIARNEGAEARQLTRAARAKLDAVGAEVARTDILQRAGGASLQELQLDRAKLAEASSGYNASLLREQRASLEVRQAQAELQARRSQVDGAQKNIEAAQATTEMRRAQLSTATVQAGYTQILATTPAEVVERVVSPGSLVMPGQVILRLKQTDQLRLQAYVPAGQAAAIRSGLPVQVKVLGKTIETRVSSVFHVADPKTKTVIVEALVKGQAELVPGASFTMQIALEKPSSQVSIPLGALQRDAAGESFVWKITEAAATGPVAYTCVMHPEVVKPEPGKCPKCGMELVPQRRTGAAVASRQSVKAGQVSGERVAILEGLQSGDEVVLEGYQNLAEGMPVARVKWGEDGPLELPTPQAPPASGQSPAAAPGHSGH